MCVIGLDGLQHRETKVWYTYVSLPPCYSLTCSFFSQKLQKCDEFKPHVKSEIKYSTTRRRKQRGWILADEMRYRFITELVNWWKCNYMQESDPDLWLTERRNVRGWSLLGWQIVEKEPRRWKCLYRYCRSKNSQHSLLDRRRSQYFSEQTWWI